jgi:chromosome segregation ATPase
LQRIDEVLKQLNDSNEAKNKAIKENSELQRKIEKIEFDMQQFSLTMKRNNQELDDARLHLENEVLV